MSAKQLENDAVSTYLEDSKPQLFRSVKYVKESKSAIFWGKTKREVQILRAAWAHAIAVFQQAPKTHR